MLFLSVLTLLAVIFGLSIENERFFMIAGQFNGQISVLIGFIFRLIFDFWCRVCCHFQKLESHIYLLRYVFIDDKLRFFNFLPFRIIQNLVRYYRFKMSVTIP